MQPAWGQALRAPDIRLLVDVSESALEAQQEMQLGVALAVLVHLLPEGTSAGVWTFGDTVHSLVPVSTVDVQWRKSAASALLTLGNSGPGNNLPAAIAAASPDAAVPGTSIVVITSGRLDVSASPMTNANAARELIQTAAPALAGLGVPVHTIAVSTDADRAFLANLSALTGGLALRARSSQELAQALLRLLQTISPSSNVPVSKRRFTVDESVDAFTLVLAGDSGGDDISLQTPSGLQLSPDVSAEGVEWFSNALYTLVSIAEPEEGPWKFTAPGFDRAQVRVESNLQLQLVDMPGVVPVGEASQIGLTLSLAGEMLASAALYRQFEISLAVHDPAGKPLSLASQPVGVSSEGFLIPVPPLPKAGRHELTVRLEGEGMTRELPLFVEAVAANPREIISTRVEDVPEQDLKVPAIRFGALAAVIAAVVLTILRRRRRKKLALWEQRFADPEGKGQSGLFPAIRDPGNEGN